MQKLLTVSQAAEELGVSSVRVRQFCQQGRIGEKVGPLWLIAEKELLRFAGKPRPHGGPRKKKRK